MSIKPCDCEKPDLFLAYVPRWPFRATHCKACGETRALWGSVLQAIWDVTVYPVWDGTVKVTAQRLKVKVISRGNIYPPGPPTAPPWGKC